MTRRQDMDCFWPQCSDRKRCELHGSCVAKLQRGGTSWPQSNANERSPDYQRGWDDCYARVQKVLGESFTVPVADGEQASQTKE